MLVYSIWRIWFLVINSLFTMDIQYLVVGSSMSYLNIPTLLTICCSKKPSEVKALMTVSFEDRQILCICLSTTMTDSLLLKLFNFLGSTNKSPSFNKMHILVSPLGILSSLQCKLLGVGLLTTASFCLFAYLGSSWSVLVASLESE